MRAEANASAQPKFTQDTPEVVVVGAGNWGRNLVRNLYELGALAGVADAGEVQRARVREDYPDLTLYGAFDEALASPAGALVLATPAPSHYALAKRALEAGKDVFIEKPMTLRASEARELASLADREGRVLMVGHLLLYQPAVAWMRDYLASGAAGTVRHVATVRAKLGRVRREENVWWSFAPHDVAVVLDLLGTPELESVGASGQAVLQEGVEDNVHVDLRFAGGRSAHLHASWLWPQNERRTTVIAEGQMLVYDEVAQTVTVFDKRIDDNLNALEGESFVAEVEGAAPLRLECEHFLHCLRTRERPCSDGWNGVAVVEILERAQEALRG